MNISINFIPHRIITVRGNINALLRKQVYKDVKKSRTLHDLQELNLILPKSIELINKTKEYCEKKLTYFVDPTGPNDFGSNHPMDLNLAQSTSNNGFFQC